MKIIVCIKQVPNTNEVKIDPKTGTLIREGVPSIINPDDRNALEAALVLKEENDAEVIVLSMGPPQAEFAIREALALGADRGILLSDSAFAGSDTWATSYILAAAIRKIGQFDLVLCGRQAIDGDTAQVGPEIAEFLDIPQVTYVKKITMMEHRKVVIERMLEDGYEVVETSCPLLLTTVKELNEPRYPTVGGIIDAFDKQEITLWTATDIGVDPKKIGLKGSPTRVLKTFTPPPKGKGKILQGSPKEMVFQLIQELSAKNVL
ncbi:MAG: electron transfer flavoprotein subunit beta/FixA family protein [Peptococcaceae bacterium]|nr:electron transfer flavoprotein subunit beta/FixA family protein [Peptococcaceae bacterium]MDH7524857.1 electron transfer flavoprotein subunit beta/FixA family protein [Peptococcaceae bacterium]